MQHWSVQIDEDPLFAFKKRGMICAWVLVSLFLSAYSLFLYFAYRSTSLDLGLHSQLLWNLARGRFMTTSLVPHSFCADHFWPGLYLLIPVHELLGVPGLLIVQAIVVTAGVFPVYYLTRDLTDRTDWATVLGICYLLHPTVLIGVLFDFHPELLSMPCVIAMLYMFHRRRFAWGFLFWALSLAFYEVTALVFCLYGLLLIFRKSWRLPGFVLLILSAVYIGVVFFLIMPAFRDALAIPHMERWIPPVVTGRDVRQLWYLLVAVGLLPLLAPVFLLPAVPLLAILMMSNLNLQMDIRFGYVAPAIPFFFLAAAYGVRRLMNLQWARIRTMKRLAPRAVLLLSIILAVYFETNRPIRARPFRLKPNLESIREASARVPPEASLSADNHLGAHFSERPVLLLTPQTRSASGPVEYVLTDLLENEFKDDHWWKEMRSLIAGGTYSPVFFSNGIVLLRESERSPELTGEVLNFLDQRHPIKRKD